MLDSNKAPNRLIDEKSPYLMQHAYNPVNWYPWGKEAFDLAEKEGKPVFLSIGYSTCHWCHVMAHESFEDEEVAELLNQHFISIKVDKEERPDIDSIYMQVCQGMTGSGGWPLTVIMDGKQRPFFAGTYFAKHKAFGRPGLIEILLGIVDEWKTDRTRLEEVQEKVMKWLKYREKAATKEMKSQVLSKETESRKLIFRAVRELSEALDEEYGGFGRSPKFPMAHNLMFLMRFYQEEMSREDGDKELGKRAGQMVEKTLTQMYKGGIFDHLGGGFSRYSTDDKWLIPHFEKMLYDNCLLAIGYLEAYSLFQKPLYLYVAEKTLQYLMSEMREGAFVSAQDADSEGEEGKFYAFSIAEIKDVLGEEKAKEFCNVYGVTKVGNFEGKNVLNLLDGIKEEGLLTQWKKEKEALYQYRAGRHYLHRDDKILLSWNSMAVVAFSKAGRLLNREDYKKVAIETMSFLQKNLRDERKNMYVSWRQGQSRGEATLDEYAYYGWALLELYEATLKEDYIKEAFLLTNILKKKFWDEEAGGFFLTDRYGEKLIYRPKEVFDGAIPSGNGVAGYFFSKLYRQTQEKSIGDLTEKQLLYLRENTADMPQSHCLSMMALLMEYGKKSFLCENGVCN